MSLLLGADAGGTKTTVLLADGGRVIGRTVGGPGAVRPGRALAASARIAETVRRALTGAGLLQADLLVIGAAGAGREPERTELRDGLRNERVAERVVVVGDLDIALEAAFGSDPGIVLVSGTGSVAIGRTPDGVVHRVGGYGWQIGDEGGGFALGRAGLAAVGKAHDGRGPKTRLSQALLQATPAGSFEELIRWTLLADPTEIAALAQVVFREAGSGDAVALRLVQTAAEELAALAGALLQCFGSRKSVALALAGGNLLPDRGLREPLLEVLKKTPRIHPQADPVDPAQGALEMARRMGG